jgi:hypothetical protein
MAEGGADASHRSSEAARPTDCYQDNLVQNRSITLYNVMFPIWFLLVFPVAWLVVVPANFVIDSLVLLAGLSWLGIDGKKDVYRRAIVRIVAFGFLSDLAGALLLFATVLSSSVLPTSQLLGDVQRAVSMDPWSHPLGLLIVTAAVAIAGALIYALNLRFALAGTKLAPPTKRRLCVVLAVVTAPWVFYVPSALLYR